MANSHIQQAGIPKLPSRQFRYSQQHLYQRSKKRMKHQKISKCSQRAKVSRNNKKNFDLEVKKLWHFNRQHKLFDFNFNKQHKLSDLATQYSLIAEIKI